MKANNERDVGGLTQTLRISTNSIVQFHQIRYKGCILGLSSNIYLSTVGGKKWMSNLQVGLDELR